MAPIKFENNIKEKLEQRQLQPSANAWAKLQSKLDANASNKNKKSFWWFGMAASFVGILIMVSVFTNNPEENTTESIITGIENGESSNESEMVDQSSDTSINDKTEDLTNENQDQKSRETITSEPILKKQQPKKQNRLVEKEAEKALAQVDIKSDEIERKEDAVLTKTLTFEDLKVQEVLAQINALKETNKQVTDAEIDALLDKVEKEINLQKLYNESSNTVNANALLHDVEADLEQSFRDRIFQAIKSGYHEVKTAVVERNN